jgi:hypothetical protein
MEVRVVLAGQLPVGFFEVVVGHIPIDTENFVVIAFRHGHWYTSRKSAKFTIASRTRTL